MSWKMDGTNARTLPNVSSCGSLRQSQKLLHSETQKRLNSISFIVSGGTRCLLYLNCHLNPTVTHVLTESVYCATVKRYFKRFNGRLAARSKLVFSSREKGF